MAPTGLVSRDKLLALLWPDLDPGRARRALSNALYVVKKGLGEESVSTVGDDLRFDPRIVPVDVLEFEDAVARGDLENAARLYAGPLLEGVHVREALEFERWVDGERERLAGLYADVLEELAEKAAEEGRETDASEWWRRLAVQDPYNTRVALAFMAALARAGDRAGALRYAQVHTTLMREEFGAEPASDVWELAERLRQEGYRPPPDRQRQVESPDVPPAPSVTATPSADSADESAAGDVAFGEEVPLAPRSGTAVGPQALLEGLLNWYHGEKGRQRISGPGLLVMTALLIVAGMTLSLFRGGSADSGPIQMVAPAPTEDDRPSIAILPFDNLSPSPNDAWFADGVQEDITTALSRISAIGVPARSSVAQFRDNRPDSREMASLLGVAYLLEGSGRIVGTEIKVTVQLIEGSAGRHVWSEEYDASFSMNEVIRLSSQIAQRVASEIGARLAPSEEEAISSLPTEDLTAYRLVHRARLLWNQRTEPEVREAIALYQEAIARDSLYADAYAGLASAYLILSAYALEPEQRGVETARAAAAAERALRLNPVMGIPHAVIAFVKDVFEWNWESADREFRTAIELEPDRSQAHCWYSAFLAGMGRREEALRRLASCEQLDPLSPWIPEGAPAVLYLVGEYERSIEAVAESVAANPEDQRPYVWMCLSYLALRRIDEGLEACQAAQDFEENSAVMAVVYAHRGEREAALLELERVVETHGSSGNIPWDGAAVYTTLGDLDEAFLWLRSGIDEDRLEAYLVPGDPRWDPLRADPRFDEILREMGVEGVLSPLVGGPAPL
jgi:TolB-like protein/DNA-binding SARP family transcriptional activator/Tfp pilus assembly protein PilF